MMKTDIINYLGCSDMLVGVPFESEEALYVPKKRKKKDGAHVSKIWCQYFLKISVLVLPRCFAISFS